MTYELDEVPLVLGDEQNWTKPHLVLGDEKNWTKPHLVLWDEKNWTKPYLVLGDEKLEEQDEELDETAPSVLKEEDL